MLIFPDIIHPKIDNLVALGTQILKSMHFPNGTSKIDQCALVDGFSSLVQRLKVVETCVKTVEPFRALQVEAVFDADFP